MTVPDTQPKERFRWPVMLLGIVLIPVNCVWIARSEGLDGAGFPTYLSLFYNVIFCIVGLLLVNVFLRRNMPGLVLSRRELLVVYAMLVTGSSLVGLDYILMLVAAIPHAAYFATPENRWAEILIPHLPKWLTIGVVDEAVKKYELGHSALTWEYLRVWIGPVIAWSVFILAIAACWLAINVLLRKQWVEHEKLSYPIVQIPLLITENGGANSLFRGKVFWLGFGLAAAIDIVNGLSQYYPSIPYIDVKMHDISAFFVTPPWNAITFARISYYPFAIGLSFFMPTNMSFSCWFFFLVRKLELVAAAALGMTTNFGQFPYIREQAYGAWMAMFAATLWFGRGYLRQTIRTAMNPAGGDQGRTYRLALIVLGIGMTVSVAFLIVAGMTPRIALLYVVGYLFFCASITRVRSELGPPTHEMTGVSTTNAMVAGIGTAALGANNISMFSLLFFQNVLYRGLLMPQQAECLKAAHDSGLRQRTMIIALVIATVVGVYAAFWGHLNAAYMREYKADWNPTAPGTAFANMGYVQAAARLANPVPTDWGAVGGMTFGAVVALILARLSVGIYGFPFHPAGYAVGMAFGLDYIWFPVMMSWAAKVLILRYSGLQGYRRAVPFFVGLVLGQFVVGGMWNFVRGIVGVHTYSFYL